MDPDMPCRGDVGQRAPSARCTQDGKRLFCAPVTDHVWKTEHREPVSALALHRLKRSQEPSAQAFADINTVSRPQE